MQTFGEDAVRTAGYTRFARRSGVAAVLLLTVGLAGACSPTIDNNGNIPLADTVDKIQPGKTNRQAVTRLLGSPSTQSPFAKNKIWYYIGQRTETIAFFAPEVLEQKVLEIRFDDRGVVKSVQRIDATKVPKVEIVDRVTPTTGKELTLLEQLIGNIGRFNSGGKSGNGS